MEASRSSAQSSECSGSEVWGPGSDAGAGFSGPSRRGSATRHSVPIREDDPDCDKDLKPDGNKAPAPLDLDDTSSSGSDDDMLPKFRMAGASPVFDAGNLDSFLSDANRDEGLELVVDVLGADRLQPPVSTISDGARGLIGGQAALLHAVYMEMRCGTRWAQTRCYQAGRVDTSDHTCQVRFEGERLVFPYNSEASFTLSVCDRRRLRGMLGVHDPVVGQATVELPETLKNGQVLPLEVDVFRDTLGQGDSAGKVKLHVQLVQAGKNDTEPPPEGGPLRMKFIEAEHLPNVSGIYVKVKVLSELGECFARTRSGNSVANAATQCAEWGPDVVTLPHRDLTAASQATTPKGRAELAGRASVRRRRRSSVTFCLNDSPSSWPMNAIVRFSLYRCANLRKSITMSSGFVGRCTVPLKELIERPRSKWMVYQKNADALLSPNAPYWPIHLVLELDAPSFPQRWPRPRLETLPETYPKHVFVMTRGTRGDVQPFVALARGMAETHGWLVTICTEQNWRDFVKKNSKVKRGKIRFRPCGGDTEARMSSWDSQVALSSRTEAIQMIIMANSEFSFFSSVSSFVYHIKAADREPAPVDLILFACTSPGVALLASEACGKKVAGFILQPSIIPSQDHQWTAVQAVNSGSLIDNIEEYAFTSHGTLDFLKEFTERNAASGWSLNALRGWYGLKEQKDSTWNVMKRRNLPIVIPMREGTFPRPSDWWPNVHMTDFIFLRSPPTASGRPPAFDEPLGGFIRQAREAQAKLVLMTFSSMPVARGKMLRCALRMVEECSVADCRVIYVGKEQGVVPAALADRVAKAKAEVKLLEIGGADFGLLFAEMDAFVVHGGLGTTVEALRTGKPTVVTGPMVLDQRFWAKVVEEKLGPKCVHIDDFEAICVEFVSGALDPTDPLGWQATAATSPWGDKEADGVAENVKCVSDMLTENMKPHVLRVQINSIDMHPPAEQAAPRYSRARNSIKSTRSVYTSNAQMPESVTLELLVDEHRQPGGPSVSLENGVGAFDDAIELVAPYEYEVSFVVNVNEGDKEPSDSWSLGSPARQTNLGSATVHLDYPAVLDCVNRTFDAPIKTRGDIEIGRINLSYEVKEPPEVIQQSDGSA